MRLNNQPCVKCGVDTLHKGPTCTVCGSIAQLKGTAKRAREDRWAASLGGNVSLARHITSIRRARLRAQTKIARLATGDALMAAVAREGKDLDRRGLKDGTRRGLFGRGKERTKV